MYKVLLNVLHLARQGFIKAESSERIRREQRKQVRTLDSFHIGDRVYYKFMDSFEWKCPGILIGQDGVVVFVRHGRATTVYTGVIYSSSEMKLMSNPSATMMRQK